MGKIHASLSDLEDNGRLGDWCIFENETGLHLFLRYPHPDGYGDLPEEEWRGELVHLPITKDQKQDKHWLWNGSYDSPTLTPSINVIGQWHGYLTDGKLITV